MCIQWAHVLYSVGRPTMFAHLNNTSQVEAQNVFFQSLPQFLTLSKPFFHNTIVGKVCSNGFVSILSNETFILIYLFLCHNHTLNSDCVLYCFSMVDTYLDQFGGLDFRRSQHGSGMSGKSLVIYKGRRGTVGCTSNS